MRAKTASVPSIRRQVLRVLFLPVAATLVLAAVMLVSELRKFREAAELGHMMAVVTALSNTVHELQKERGATSVFLNSRGEQFGPELAAQRQKTDPAVTTLDTVLNATGTLPGDLQPVIDSVRKGLGDLPANRKAVDDQSVDIASAIGYFTKLNGQMLSAIGLIGAIGTDAGIVNQVKGYEAFLYAKESAGLERAVGSGGFAAGGFTVARLLSLQRLVAQQELGFQIFRQSARRGQIAELDALTASPAFAELERLRKLAFTSPETGDLGGTTGPAYFQAATEVINGLKTIEDHLAMDIGAAVAAGRRAALILLTTLLSATMLMLAALWAVSRRAIGSMLGGIAEIARCAGTMSEGNLDAALPARPLVELQPISDALGQFRDSILETRQREAEAAESKREAEQKVYQEREKLRRADDKRRDEEARQARERQETDRRHADEIAKVVAACARGDFSRRLSLEDKDGAIAEIADGLNRISESVGTSLGALKAALEHLAAGDLRHRIDGRFDGIFGEIAKTVNVTEERLAEVLTEIIRAAGSVDGATREISTATDDLARRSEKNAAMLEQTAAALQQMQSSVSNASLAAQSARQAMQEMAGKADHGGEVVRQSIAAMEEIRASSQGIERILHVIDDISFQTNLLALNAGVEAARAGEAGRGFAVVASEVRALAQRSSDSASEIATMIARSAESVQRGVVMVNDSGDALAAIVSDIRGVGESMDQIATAFEETRQGIDEVSTATAQLDRTTQQNAAMFEETNAAVQSLEGEAAALTRQTATFRLSDEDAVDRTRAA